MALAIDGTIQTGNANNASAVAISSALVTALTNDVLCLVIHCENGATPPTVASIAGGGLAWTKRRSYQFTDGNSTLNNVEVWWAVAAATFNSILTITFTSAFDDAGVIAFAVNGANTAAPWDTNGSLGATNQDTVSVTPTLPQVTGVSTTATNAMLLAFAFSGNNSDNGAQTAASGFTLMPGVDNQGGTYSSQIAGEYKVVSAAQSAVTVAFGSTTWGQWGMLVEAIVAAGGAVVAAVEAARPKVLFTPGGRSRGPMKGLRSVKAYPVGSVLYNQTINATSTSSVSLARGIGHSIAVGCSSVMNALKGAAKTLPIASTSSTTTARSAGKTVTAASTSSVGSVLKSVSKSLAIGCSSAISMAKAIAKGIVVGAMSGVGIVLSPSIAGVLTQTLVMNGGGITGTDTYTGATIGSAFSSRVVVAMIQIVNGPGSTSPVTIGGVVATTSEIQVGSGGAVIIFAAALVPTGTTADIIATGSGGFQLLGVWSVAGKPALATMNLVTNGFASTTTMNITAETGGIILALGADGAGIGSTLSFTTGITLEGTQWPADSNTVAAITGAANTASAGSTTLTLAGASFPIMVAATYRPAVSLAQSIAAGCASSVSFARAMAKSLAVSSASAAAVVTGAARFQTITVGCTTAVNWLKRAGKALAVTSTSSTISLRGIGKQVAISSSSVVAVGKAVTHTVVVTSTSSTVLGRLVNKAIAAVSTTSTALTEVMTAFVQGLSVGMSQGFLFRPGRGPSWDIKRRQAFPASIAPSNTTYNQTINATSTSSVSVAKGMAHALGVACGSAIAVARRTNKALTVAGTSTTLAARQSSKIVTVASATATVLAASRAILKTITVGCASAVNVARGMAKSVAISSTSAVTLLRGVAKTIASTCTSAVVASSIKVKIVIINVISTSAVTLSRAMTKTVVIPAASAVAVLKGMAKSIAVLSSSAVTTIKSMSKTLVVASASAVVTAQIKAHTVIINVLSSSTVTLLKSMTKAVAIASLTGTIVTKRIPRVITAISTTATNTLRSVGKAVNLSGATSVLVVTGRAATVVITVGIATAVNLSRAIAKGVAVGITGAVTATKAITHTVEVTCRSTLSILLSIAGQVFINALKWVGIPYRSRAAIVTKVSLMSLSPLNWSPKDPDEVDDRDLKWGPSLDGDTVVSSTWTQVYGDGMITMQSDSFSSTTTKLWLAGGTVNTRYVFRNNIITAAGRHLDRTVRISIEQH